MEPLVSVQDWSGVQGAPVRFAAASMTMGMSAVPVMVKPNLRRVQSAPSSAERHGHAFRVFRRGERAVPQACAAVNAFLAVEIRYAVFSGRDGLAGTDFDAQFRPTALALVRENKRDVIGVAGRRVP